MSAVIFLLSLQRINPQVEDVHRKQMLFNKKLTLCRWIYY